jgi:anti-anti-sigma factor
MPVDLIADDGGVVRLKADGKITYSQTTGEPDPIRTLLGPDPFSRKVLINMEQLTFIDSSGIGWLLASHKRFRKSGGALVLHSLPESVLLTLQVLRLDIVLNIAADEAAALERVK